MRQQTIAVWSAGAILAAATLVAQPAAAVPVSNLAPAAENISMSQDVAWACGPFRCWWTPRYAYAPVVVAPRAYYGYPAYGYGYGYGGYGRPLAYSYRVRPAWGYGGRRGYYRRW